MLKNIEKIHRYIYIFGITFLGAMMPWSEFFMSAVQFMLLGNWILEGGFKKKLQILKERKSIIVFISIILVHFIWLFNTSDIKYALHDIQIKIPLLIIPLIIGTTKIITKKEFYIILKFFVASVFVATLFSVAVYLGLTKFEYVGYRSMSVFISHIRFSLMIDMAIVIAAFFIAKSNKLKFKTYYLFLVIWLSFFIFFLQSLTGIVIFIILSIIFAIYLLFKIKKTIYKVGLFFLILSSFIFFTIWIINSYNRYKKIGPENLSNLKTYSITHKGYFNKIKNKTKENGNLVYIHIIDEELKSSWKVASELNFDSLDKKGNVLRYTIYRYMASKGLTKDSAGFSKLTRQDIINIENGMPNYLFENKLSPYVIFYKILWEYDAYKNNKDINNKSILQRAEYFKTGLEIFLNNKLIGIGTGDIQDEFNKYYIKNNSELELKNRRRTHNQYLTFLITFGITGGVIVLFGLLYPIFFEKNKENVLLISFLIIVLLSFINEDTLETQPGVTFFVYFYCLFLFGYKRD